VDGYVSEMSVSIPWKALFTDSCFVEVTGMQLTIQPKQRADDGNFSEQLIVCSLY
jgi:autophagy-related protein 2